MDMDSQVWDRRYAEPGWAYGTQPNVFIPPFAEGLKPGAEVLVPADGEGRNGVWLAQQGFTVTSVDQSGEGCSKALELAASRGVGIEVVQADLTQWSWPVEAFDAVVSVFLHMVPGTRGHIHHQMAGALRPGGQVLIVAFHPRHDALREGQPCAGGPRDVSRLYTLDLLQDDFAGLDFVEGAEEELDLAEGRFHVGRSAVTWAVFRR